MKSFTSQLLRLNSERYPEPKAKRARQQTIRLVIELRVEKGKITNKKR